MESGRDESKRPRHDKELGGPLLGYRSCRVLHDDYRIIYKIQEDDCTILVYAVGDRGSVYDEFNRYISSKDGLV